MEKSMFKSWTTVLCGLAMLMGAGGAASGVIQDQQEAKPVAKNVEVVVMTQDQEKKKELDLGDGNRIQIQGDQIVITDANGKTRSIDISGAANVQVQQSVQTTNENGKQKAKFSGQAIVISPDGEKQVIELQGPVGDLLKNGNLKESILMWEGADDLAEGVFKFRVDGSKDVFLPGKMNWRPVKPSQFMIGVHCQPVDDSLRSHLQLEDGVGLIISQVTKDSPAEKSGVLKHDILLHVGDQDLTDTSSLSKLVDEAGQGEEELAITAIRKGKEVSITVKPKKRPQQLARYRLDMEEMGPGIVMPKAPQMPNPPKAMNVPNNFGDEFKAMREEMERIRKELRELRRNRNRD